MEQQAIKESAFNEVFDWQKSFRVLMDAMSMPGNIRKLYKHYFDRYPQGFNPSLLTVLKTFGDNNVKFSISNIGNEDFVKYIEINTGMAYSSTDSADYVIYDGKTFDETIFGLKRGTLEFPQDSATVIILVEDILNELFYDAFIDRTVISMIGPGIKEKNIVTIIGLDNSFVKNIMEINSSFPLGLDVIFIDFEGNIVCMPRTTKGMVR